MFRLCLCLLTLVVLVLLVSTTAQAQLVNVTTGKVIFSDSFETGVVGTVPVLSEPEVGTYSLITEGEGTTLRIDDGTLAGYSPYDGSKMLYFNRPVQTYPIIDALSVPENSGEGDLIRLTYAIHPDELYPSLVFKTGTSGANTTWLGYLNFEVNTGKVQWHDYYGSPTTYLAQTITPNEWNEMVVEHVNGTDQWSFSINGGTAETMTDSVNDHIIWDSIRFFPGMAGSSFSIDMKAISTPLDGDLNDDGFVGGDDLDIVRSFWGQTVPQGDLSKGDPSNDGFVGGDDLDIVRANWGQGNPPAAGAVPEPGTLLLLFAGAACLSAVSRGGRLTKKDCRG